MPLKHTPKGLWLVIVCCVCLGAGMQSCYTYRTHAPGYPGVTDEYKENSVVVWNFFWGFVTEQPEVDNCNGQALAEVTVRSNFAFDLLSVVTLGIVAPKTVEWRCARATPDEGEIDLGLLPTSPPADNTSRDDKQEIHQKEPQNGEDNDE